MRFLFFLCLASHFTTRCYGYSRVPLEEREKTVGLLSTAIFSVFGGYFFGNFRAKASVIIAYMLRSPSSVFQWSRNAWLWMTSKRDSSCFVLALVPDASASTSLPRLTYINVPLSTTFIFIVLNWTASGSLPCFRPPLLESALSYQILDQNGSNLICSMLGELRWYL